MTTDATPDAYGTPNAERWEYMYYNVTIGEFSKEIQTLNAAGAQGWELVTALPLNMGAGARDPALTSSVLLLFKRRQR